MIPAVLLACAMALPPSNFRPIAANPMLEEIEKLKTWIRGFEPGAEVKITPLGQPGGLAWERLPLLWRGMAIWIKRPAVHDQKMKGSA